MEVVGVPAQSFVITEKNHSFSTAAPRLLLN